MVKITYSSELFDAQAEDDHESCYLDEYIPPEDENRDTSESEDDEVHHVYVSPIPSHSYTQSRHAIMYMIKMCNVVVRKAVHPLLPLNQQQQLEIPLDNSIAMSRETTPYSEGGYRLLWSST